MRRRNYCFTVNNPDGLLDVNRWKTKPRILVYQEEMGTNGTLHLQGYMEFTQALTINQIHALEGLEGAHLEARRGTKNQAISYCEKQDETFIGGPYYWPDKDAVDAVKTHGGEQGRRTDLESAVADVKAGKSTAELIENHPVVVVKYHRGLDYVRVNMTKPQRSPNMPKDCVMYWGPPGTGKSFRLLQECPPGPDWFWCQRGKWFDGYQGQPGLVFDEIRDSWYQFEFLLKLIDRYPLKVEIKGGTIEMLATRFRMSSNVHPKKWYKNANGRPNSPWAESPLRRRFSQIIKLTEVYNEGGEMDVEDEDEPSSEEAPLRPDAHGVLWHVRD